MFESAHDFSIRRGIFIVNTRKEGVDLWGNHIAPGAFHNSRERLEYDPPKCHPETRVAIIRAIIDWIEDGQKTTFIKWLNGPAGAGKSAIAQRIAELCHESGCLAASFFWSRNAAGRNNQDRLIASLAYQLLTAIPLLRLPIEEAVEGDPYIFTRSLATQMKALVIQPLKKVFDNNYQGGVDTPKVIILDGLDECGTPEAQQLILELVADSIRKFPIPLCFLIASRPEKAFRDSFNVRPLLPITDQLVLDERYRPDDDIRLFLIESFESVKRTHELRLLLPHVWPTEGAIWRLVGKSSGQFIYAAIVVKFVASPRQRPDKQLDIVLGITAAGSSSPFAEIDALYCQILDLVPQEDINKALEIIAMVMVLASDEDELTPREIETLLAYPHGEVQRVLIDLHSILYVPAIGDNENKLRVLHASLGDYLMDPSHSTKYCIPKDQAYARVAQHFLRYLREYPRDTEDQYSCVKLVFDQIHAYWGSVPTSLIPRELLNECFDFDPVKWVSTTEAYPDSDLQKVAGRYMDVFLFREWLEDEDVDAKAMEYFGRSLNAHLARSWELATDLICAELCRVLHAEYPKCWRNAATALMHPKIMDYFASSQFRRVIGVEFYWGNIVNFDPDNEGPQMVYIRNYLRDRSRAGSYYVDGGSYATLCMYLFNFIFSLNEEEDDDDFDDNDDDDEIFDDDKDDNATFDNHSEVSDQDALDFAIRTLPFYLSQADYRSKLSELASLLCSQGFGERHSALRRDLLQLDEAIDLYIKASF